jgi:GntR family transcriptional regulator
VSLTLSVDLEDPTPPYEQLRRQLALSIRTGRLSPDERLPPLRQLAGDLGLAVGTVARTYRELEAAGLVRSRRGGGTRVAATIPTDESAASVRARVDEAARAFVRTARSLGASAAQAHEAVDRAMTQPEVPVGETGRGPDPVSAASPASRSRAAAYDGRLARGRR